MCSRSVQCQKSFWMVHLRGSKSMDPPHVERPLPPSLSRLLSHSCLPSEQRRSREARAKNESTLQFLAFWLLLVQDKVNTRRHENDYPARKTKRREHWRNSIVIKSTGFGVRQTWTQVLISDVSFDMSPHLSLSLSFLI